MQKPYLLCIGHRGAMGHEPENTLRSIRKALALGSPCVEVDVYSVDGHLVVFHDDRLERTTDGVGYLSEQSFEYLRSLDAGGGQRIPTLEEVCEVIDSRAGLNIELKGPGTAAPVVELVSNLIENGWHKDAFLVSSFNHRELLEVKRLSQQIKLGALIKGLPVDDAKFAEDLDAFSVHLSLEFIDQRFVDDAHARGLKVYVYTVNHPEDISRMYQLGVDGVFTSFPERVLENYAQGERANRWI
jgi:glycerophosphoryl diester phosphodiesterase